MDSSNARINGTVTLENKPSIVESREKKSKKMMQRMINSNTPQYKENIFIIYGTNKLDGDRSSKRDIANGLICAATLQQMKYKDVRVFVSVFLLGNKGNGFRKYRFQKTNSVFKDAEAT